MKQAGHSSLPQNSKKGRSIPEWVHKGRDALEDLSFVYTKMDLEEQMVEGDSATLIVRAEVLTVMGEFLQRERHELVREGGRRLINESEILEEKFNGMAMKGSLWTLGEVVGLV